MGGWRKETAKMKRKFQGLETKVRDRNIRVKSRLIPRTETENVGILLE